ncbi:GIY-YIG nuclease family protein [Streptomyces sp. NPDC058701]|uniref:GIY-YIG nuclease family protein n=1 Tax=Streptomyces sp. NPDC058701 TaxID=3346608 RepID=UPI00365C56E3
MRESRTALYRLYDESEDLLYVGIAFDPRHRWKTHAREKPWWAEVHVREIEWFPTRVEAEEAEASAIKGQRPKHNVIGNVPIRALPAQRKSQRRPDRSVEEMIAALEARRKPRRPVQ